MSITLVDLQDQEHELKLSSNITVAGIEEKYDALRLAVGSKQGPPAFGLENGTKYFVIPKQSSVISYDDAQQRFNRIADTGSYTDSTTKLQAFLGQIEAAVQHHYGSKRGDYDSHLDKSPSTVPESDATSSTIDEEAQTEQLLPESMFPCEYPATTRSSLPAKLIGKADSFSSAKLDLNVTITHFEENYFKDNDEKVSTELRVHLEIARLMIKWRFYQSGNIVPFTSPSKPLKNPDERKVKAMGLMESHVQDVLSRVLFPLCNLLGVSVHDARSYPKLFLKKSKQCGYTDFLFCRDGVIIGFLEVKVFFYKNYMGQVAATNFSISAGVNGSWDVTALDISSATHIVGALCNGFDLFRCQTSGSTSLVTDKEPVGADQMLNGLWQMLSLSRLSQQFASISISQASPGDENNSGDDHKGRRDTRDGNGGGSTPKEQGARNRGGGRQQRAKKGQGASSNGGGGRRRGRQLGGGISKRAPLQQMSMSTLNVLLHTMEQRGDEFMEKYFS